MLRYYLLVIYFLLLIFFCTYAFLAGLYGNIWYRLTPSFVICISKYHHHHQRSLRVTCRSVLEINLNRIEAWSVLATAFLNQYTTDDNGVFSCSVNDLGIIYIYMYIYMYIYIYIHILFLN
jgi:hypothetical protein